MAANRVQAVIDEFELRKPAGERIIPISMVAHQQASRPQAGLTVCGPDPLSNVAPLPAERFDEPIELQIHSTRITVPLRYLEEVYWVDTPLGVKDLGSFARFSFGWPALTDYATRYNNGCFMWQNQGCRRSQVFVTMYGPSDRKEPLASFALEEGTRKLFQTNDGLIFYSRRAETNAETNADGYSDSSPPLAGLHGRCSWGEIHPDGSAPTESEALSVLRSSPNASCTLFNVKIAVGLNADVEFPASGIFALHDFHASVVRLFDSFHPTPVDKF